MACSPYFLVRGGSKFDAKICHCYGNFATGGAVSGMTLHVKNDEHIKKKKHLWGEVASSTSLSNNSFGGSNSQTQMQSVTRNPTNRASFSRV